MSNYRKEKKDLVVEHQHSFEPSFDLSGERCSCGAVLISEEEKQRRIEEWNAYYEYVKTTDSYRDYQKMREAFKNHNLSEVREIMERVSKRLKEDYADKPNFPDPNVWNKYIINYG